eukprot:5479033-Alexandrium_andersonii.AAC.1
MRLQAHARPECSGAPTARPNRSEGQSRKLLGSRGTDAWRLVRQGVHGRADTGASHCAKRARVRPRSH